MSAAGGGNDAVPPPGALPFGDDSYLGYDTLLHPRRFNTFDVDSASPGFSSEDALSPTVSRATPAYDAGSPFQAPISTPEAPPTPPIYSGLYGPDHRGFTQFSEESNGTAVDGAFGSTDGPIRRPPTEMEPEECFALMEWRLQNAVRLEEKQRREKDLVTQIRVEAEEYKIDFHRKRNENCEVNRKANREKEKTFLANQEKFHAEAGEHYWKAIAELIPREVPTVKPKPAIFTVQGPKPGKPTDLSRMRKILMKLQHSSPPNVKSPPPPPPPIPPAATNANAAAVSRSVEVA